MATAVVIPLSEYLTTSYEHDCEWVDGEIRERGMPDEFHSAIQSFLLVYLSKLGLRTRAELRVRVTAQRFRIPDVCVLAADAPLQPIPDAAPLLCVEVLSPDDSMSEMQEKIADYVAMGVTAIWVIDPRRRALFMADREGTRPVDEVTAEALGIRLGVAEIFAELDGLAARE